MKFKFSTSPTQGSFYDESVGLDYLAPTGGLVTKAASKRGWRFTGFNSVERNEQLTRARDLAELSTDELASKYNPAGQDVRSGTNYSDPYVEYFDDVASIPTLDDFRKLGFTDQIRTLNPEDANKQYGLKGHLQFQENVSNLEAWLLNQRKKEEIQFNYVLSKAEGWQAAKGFGIELSMALLDPVGLMIGAATPPIGSASILGKLGWTGSKTATRAVQGGLSGFYGSALVEPMIYSAATQEQADYRAIDSLMNVTFGTIVGGGLHVVGGKIADTVKGFNRKRHISALRTAINQVNNGENVEVAPIIHGANQAPEQVPSLNFDEPSKADLDARQTAAGDGIPKATEDILTPVVEHGPAVDVDASLKKIESQQGAAKLTGFSFKKLWSAAPELSDAYQEGVKLGKKQNFAVKMTDQNGNVVLVKSAPGKPLKLFDTEDLSLAGQPVEVVGEKIHQALLMHGVSPTNSNLSYRGSFSFDGESVTHVLDMEGVTFDPSMNQKQTVISTKEEAGNLFKDTPMHDVFSEYAPKGRKGVAGLFDEGPIVNQRTPEDAISLAGVDEALNAENLKQVGPSEGTLPGGRHVDLATGEEFYVKYTETSGQATNEFIAATLYRMLGVDFPLTKLVAKDGKVVGVASKILPDINTISPEQFKNLDLPVKAEFAKELIIDMFLGNWDVIGNAPNWNIYLKPDGTVGRLDPGGALLYRAQGKKKVLSDTFDELKTFFDPIKNKHTRDILVDVLGTAPTKGDLFSLSKRAVKRILELDEADIYKLASISGFEDARELTNALLKRQVYLQDLFGEVDLKELGITKQKNKIVLYTKSDALEYIKTQAKNYFNKFSEATKSAIKSYGNTYYKDINKILRGEWTGPVPKNLQDLIDNIDKGMEVSTTTQTLSVYRSKTPTSAFSGLIKGISLWDAKDIVNARKMIGATFELKGFTSTSFNRPFAKNWDSQSPLLTIEVPPGTKAIYGDPKIFPIGQSEYELLLDRGLNYRIKDVGTLPNGRINFFLEVLPKDWKPAPKVNKQLAIKIAKAHKEDSSSAVNDSNQYIQYESDSAVQTTLKPDDMSAQTAEIEKGLDDILLDIDAELANMDDDLIAAFSKQVEEINAQANADLSLAQDLYKAAQAAAVCVKGAG